MNTIRDLSCINTRMRPFIFLPLFLSHASTIFFYCLNSDGVLQPVSVAGFGLNGIRCLLKTRMREREYVSVCTRKDNRKNEPGSTIATVGLPRFCDYKSISIVAQE